jgi:hypothetical protein
LISRLGIEIEIKTVLDPVWKPAKKGVSFSQKEQEHKTWYSIQVEQTLSIFLLTAFPFFPPFLLTDSIKFVKSLVLRLEFKMNFSKVGQENMAIIEPTGPTETGGLVRPTIHP